MNYRPLLLGCLLLLLPVASVRAQAAAPLCVGQTFEIKAKELGETRRVNVYLPPGYTAATAQALPVLLMLDGGLAEDFLHVAGLVQVGVGNETMRPFLLVGIENTERRRDLTGPTTQARDLKIAPRVGGSAAFRRFLRHELLPEVRRRYRTTPETAVVGESLAGLFVVETLLLEPDLFDTYLAFDPSLWWNKEQLLTQAEARLPTAPGPPKTLFLASSNETELAAAIARLARAAEANPRLRLRYAPLPTETHGTIYHPAALLAFRWALAK